MRLGLAGAAHGCASSHHPKNLALYRERAAGSRAPIAAVYWRNPFYPSLRKLLAR
jgi:hypothetical protein